MGVAQVEEAALAVTLTLITALSVSQLSARSESWAAYTLWITDHAWALSSGLSKPRMIAASMAAFATPSDHRSTTSDSFNHY